MNEQRIIDDEIRRLADSAGSAVLATVISVRGSAYRRPGARMIIHEDGRTVGLISGGCLDADVMERANFVHATGQHTVVRYDTTAREDSVWGLALGCTGIVEVLLERVPFQTPVRFATGEDEGPRVIATVLESGDKIIVDSDGAVLSGSDDAGIAPLVQEALGFLARGISGLTAIRTDGAPQQVFFDVIQPPLPLLVFGGGNDAIPLVRLAHDLGWAVTVVDHRPAYATEGRFPWATTILTGHPEEIFDRLLLTPRTVAVVMTHAITLDTTIVRHLLAAPVRYIGLLGPKNKGEKILSDLDAAGTMVDEERRRTLFNPAGLDIGAETPEEIAVSIAGEIQTLIARRPGRHLRFRNAPIHGGASIASDGTPGV